VSFVLSKLAWLVTQPGNLFFVLLVVAVALQWTRWRRASRRILAILVAVGIVVTILPLGTWLLLPLENRFPVMHKFPEKVDGIVVLGGASNQFISRARGQPALNSSAERLIAFAELARRYPAAKLVFTGGSGNLMRQDIKEAETARVVLAQLGLDTARVMFEDQARNTAESAVFARKLAQPRASETWLLITSARHMPRAYGAFKKAGWNVVAYPVDFATDGKFRFQLRFGFAGGLGGLGGGLKEWLGLAYYYVSGRIDRFFPGPPRAQTGHMANKVRG
jgi:uncharacterized SAM-binding protein YcdF (DUF218 family)